MGTEISLAIPITSSHETIESLTCSNFGEIPRTISTSTDSNSPVTGKELKSETYSSTKLIADSRASARWLSRVTVRGVHIARYRYVSFRFQI